MKDLTKVLELHDSKMESGVIVLCLELFVYEKVRLDRRYL